MDVNGCFWTHFLVLTTQRSLVLPDPFLDIDPDLLQLLELQQGTAVQPALRGVLSILWVK